MSSAVVHSFKDGFIYFAKYVEAFSTTRYPAVLLLSSQTEPISVKVGDRVYKDSAILIASRTERLLSITNIPFLALHIEPNHSLFRVFKKSLSRNRIVTLPRTDFQHLDFIIHSCYEGSTSSDEQKYLYDNLCLQLASYFERPTPKDKRINKVLQTILQSEEESFCFETLLQSTQLSASRFSHLFSEHIGLPFRSFLAWRKTKHAIELMNSSLSLTEIAYQAGFADLSHMCRTFQRSLGTSPSKIYATTNICLHI